LSGFKKFCFYFYKARNAEMKGTSWSFRCQGSGEACLRSLKAVSEFAVTLLLEMPVAWRHCFDGPEVRHVEHRVCRVQPPSDELQTELAVQFVAKPFFINSMQHTGI
jgi:hypothetical protein